MSTEEEREFQLEMLKLQIKHQTIWSSLTLLIAVEFAAFASLAATFLSFGLTSGNMFYVFVAISSLICLYIVARGTFHIYEMTKTARELEKNLEKEIQPIRDRFITKKTEQKETRKETPVTTSKTDKGEEQAETISLIAEYRVLNEAIWRRDQVNLLVNSIMISATLAIVTFAVRFRNELGKNIFFDLPNAGFIPILSLILICIPYLLWWTSTRLDDICFDRIHKIEDILHIKGQQYIWNRVKCSTLYKFRRHMWHFVFFLFLGVYIFTAIWLFRETVIP